MVNSGGTAEFELRPVEGGLFLFSRECRANMKIGEEKMENHEKILTEVRDALSNLRQEGKTAEQEALAACRSFG